MRKALLLDSTYRIISFINQKHALKLLWRDKVEVISTWEDSLPWKDKQHIQYPATVRLKSYIRKNSNIYMSFSKKALFNRDNYTCQYCLVRLPYHRLSVDHIVPVSKGGKTNFLNCVVACKKCNNIKGNKQLYQTTLFLRNEPYHPTLLDYQYYFEKTEWHVDWDSFL